MMSKLFARASGTKQCGERYVPAGCTRDLQCSESNHGSIVGRAGKVFIDQSNAALYHWHV